MMRSIIAIFTPDVPGTYTFSLSQNEIALPYFTTGTAIMLDTVSSFSSTAREQPCLW